MKDSRSQTMRIEYNLEERKAWLEAARCMDMKLVDWVKLSLTMAAAEDLMASRRGNR
jgi:hypothetical protein